MIKEILFWCLVSLSWVSTISSIILIGKEREPYSKGYAIGSVVVSIVMTFVYYFLSH